MKKEIIFKYVEKAFANRIFRIINHINKKYGDVISVTSNVDTVTNEFFIVYEPVKGGDVFRYNDAINEMMKKLGKILIFA